MKRVLSVRASAAKRVRRDFDDEFPPVVELAPVAEPPVGTAAWFVFRHLRSTATLVITPEWHSSAYDLVWGAFKDKLVLDSLRYRFKRSVGYRIELLKNISVRSLTLEFCGKKATHNDWCTFFSTTSVRHLTLLGTKPTAVLLDVLAQQPFASIKAQVDDPATFNRVFAGNYFALHLSPLLHTHTDLPSVLIDLVGQFAAYDVLV